MITISGKSVFGGVSIGKLLFYQRNSKVIKRTHIDDVDAEWKRFQEAKDTAVEQLKGLYEKALADVGEANAMIFEIHQMMLEDLDYLESIENIIRTQEVNAEYAVATTADNFAQMFAAMDDAYMQGRAADVKDVSERVLDILSGADTGLKEMTEPCIIAADDLAPSETVQLDKSKVLGFATQYGSSNSHTAILARTMNIPAIIGMGEDLLKEYSGRDAIIDGFTGTLYIDPDEETLKAMQEKREKDLEQKALLEQLKGKENITKSGQKINVYANIGNVSDLGAVLKNDAGGIGLFRSEFLYLENTDFPTEDQQFSVYKQVAESRAEITKLERNGMFVYESVPGTAVLNLTLKENGMEFSVEGPEDAQITVEMEADTEYEVFVGENLIGKIKTNLGGKLSFSVELENVDKADIRIVRV